MQEHILILHNIRSAHNVGAIFRTADAAGIARILLCGYTPAPVDRFGRPRQDIAKAALGAEKIIPWRAHDDIHESLRGVQNEGFEIVAIEQHVAAQDYKTFSPTGNIAFVLGNEVRGLPQEVLQAADVILEIPMRGTKESLNVSVAAGIVLFRTLDI
jgi:tRNA G18 (ribose-2'-O)-methylase SpoU